MKQIVTRAEALLQKQKRYYTGKLCKRGHLNERYLSSGHCVECDRVRNDPRKRLEYAREYNRQRHGLPQPNYSVTDCCEICGQSNNNVSLCLDHDHETGEFRGWLCHTCNCGIGFLGDNIEGLQRALEYLRK